MPAIIEFPTVVEQAVEECGAVFANEPERRDFAESGTGFRVAERKTVTGINGEFAVTTDQSCLTRGLTEVKWDVAPLNEKRLAWWPSDSATRYGAQGVRAIDTPLVDHEGKRIEDAGWFWDHADQRHLIAHDYLMANDVCSSGKHSALEFRRFRKREAGEAQPHALEAQAGGGEPSREAYQRLALFKSHPDLFKE